MKYLCMRANDLSRACVTLIQRAPLFVPRTLRFVQSRNPGYRKSKNVVCSTWSEMSLFWNGLFHPRVATTVYHLPIFACCKDIRSRVNRRTNNDTKQDFRQEINFQLGYPFCRDFVDFFRQISRLQTVSSDISHAGRIESSVTPGFSGHVSCYKSRS